MVGQPLQLCFALLGWSWRKGMRFGSKVIQDQLNQPNTSSMMMLAVHFTIYETTTIRKLMSDRLLSTCSKNLHMRHLLQTYWNKRSNKLIVEPTLKQICFIINLSQITILVFEIIHQHSEWVVWVKLDCLNFSQEDQEVECFLVHWRYPPFHWLRQGVELQSPQNLRSLQRLKIHRQLADSLL